jgi:hypothetical protein
VVATLAFFGWPGCVAVAGLAAWWLIRGQNLALRFIAAWWIIGCLCVGVWIPFAAARYIIPLIVPSVLLIGWSLYAGLIALDKLTASKRNPNRLASVPPS